MADNLTHRFLIEGEDFVEIKKKLLENPFPLPCEIAQKKSIPPTPPAPSKKRASDSAKKEKVSANQGFGKLNLNSKPWAWVEIDGNPLGKTTPVVLPQIPAGPHTIRLRNGDQGLEKSIQIFIKVVTFNKVNPITTQVFRENPGYDTADIAATAKFVLHIVPATQSQR